MRNKLKGLPVTDQISINSYDQPANCKRNLKWMDDIKNLVPYSNVPIDSYDSKLWYNMGLKWLGQASQVKH